MLTNTERQQIVEEVNAGTYGIDEALDDIAAAQKGEEVRKALYAEALVLNREGHAGSTDMIARQQVANLQTSVNGQISTLRTEVGDDIDDLETALNNGLATQNGKIAAQNATIANVVANYNVEYGSTELWASTGETGALAAGTTVTLSEDVSNFDYVDIYSFCGNSNVLDTVPVDAKLQSSQGYALRWVNLSDPDSGSYKAYVRIIETRLHIIGTTLTIDHQVTYRNGEEVNISGAEITQSNRSTYMGELGIMKIVGRKITANTEIEDVRIGADGTEYASAGQAVRAQVTALESAIPAVDSTLSTQGAAADAKVAGDKVAELKSAISQNVMDVLRFGTEPSSYTGGGISAEKIRDGVFHFTGTIASSNFLNYYANLNALPDWLEKGKTYYMSVSGAKANNHIYFEVLGFRNGDGSSQVSLSGMRFNNGVYAFVIPSSFVGGCYVRIGWLGQDSGTVVDETIEYHIYNAPLTGIEGIEIASSAVHFESLLDKEYASCDDVPAGTIVFVSSDGNELDIEDFPFNAPGTLVCIGHDNFPVQYAMSWNTSEIIVKSRSKGESGWLGWTEYPVPSKIETFNGWATDAGIQSCDDINQLSWYIVSSSGGVPEPNDFPFNGAGWIQTVPLNNFILQIAYSFGNEIKSRVKTGSSWSSWADVGGGQTVTITQEVSRDTYNNEYNISVNPTITTDSNGWLQPVDTNTASETGKTDMTGAIMSMLTSTGYCHLAPGIYYVSGNIDMPADSMLEGCGKQTIIRLLQSTTSGYIVRMHTRSTLKNVCLSGSYSAGDISNGNIGGRKGINYIGNRDGQSSGVSPTTCTCCQIEGCWFENLDSGFYGYNAGGGLQEGVEMSNCYFTRCKAGINIDYWTEYCKFTNIITFQCYYACINNGGNNVFTACTFHGVIGFLIDNSSGTKSNAAHGTVNGCTFNHIDNMNHPETLGNGYGIKVIDTTAGFIFANCQIWYGKVYVEDSKGVQFADCEFGGYPTIETSGNDTVFFHGCIFQSAPTKTITSPVKFDNCYTYAGANVTN